MTGVCGHAYLSEAFYKRRDSYESPEAKSRMTVPCASTELVKINFEFEAQILKVKLKKQVLNVNENQLYSSKRVESPMNVAPSDNGPMEANAGLQRWQMNNPLLTTMDFLMLDPEKQKLILSDDTASKDGRLLSARKPTGPTPDQSEKYNDSAPVNEKSPSTNEETPHDKLRVKEEMYVVLKGKAVGIMTWINMRMATHGIGGAKAVGPMPISQAQELWGNKWPEAIVCDTKDPAGEPVSSSGYMRDEMSSSAAVAEPSARSESARLNAFVDGKQRRPTSEKVKSDGQSLLNGRSLSETTGEPSDKSGEKSAELPSETREETAAVPSTAKDSIKHDAAGNAGNTQSEMRPDPETKHWGESTIETGSTDPNWSASPPKTEAPSRENARGRSKPTSVKKTRGRKGGKRGKASARSTYVTQEDKMAAAWLKRMAPEQREIFLKCVSDEQRLKLAKIMSLNDKVPIMWIEGMTGSLNEDVAKMSSSDSEALSDDADEMSASVQKALKDMEVKEEELRKRREEIKRWYKRTMRLKERQRRNEAEHMKNTRHRTSKAKKGVMTATTVTVREAKMDATIAL